MGRKYLESIWGIMLLVALVPVQADDIDLFTSSPASVTTAPNVLIVLDNTANWNTPFVNEKAALVSVVNGLPADKFRLGLMMFSETGGANSGNDGAYVRAAIRPLTSANKVLFQDLVNSFDVLGDKSNGGKVAKAMEEAYLYYSAGAPYAGNNKGKTDYLGNASGTVQDNAIYALAGNALTTKDGSSYTTPIADGCAKNFIIYISNGAAQDNNSDITQATAALTTAGGSTTAIPISPSGSQDNVADEWARFMKKDSLGITTYTVDINKVTTGQGPGWTALLKSMAGVSGGKYFDVANDGAAIANALNSIFSEIQSVNSVFSSVSLPVSVNTQGTYLNQVYIGMFRPDADSRPLWPGNLKQYKLGLIDGALKLQDADSSGAINTSTGFVTECARSFWTPSVADNYWAFRPQGECLLVVASAQSNFPDGNVVEKGGQAYMLRNAGNVGGRSVLTCGLVSCASLVNFNSTNVSGADLNPSSPLGTTERDALINWARGQDVTDEDVDAITTAEMRPSAHGDVVHSSPVAINYGGDAAGSRQVVIYYGANDGMLHAINGNRPDLDNTTIGGKAPGQELWSFVAPEFYPKLKRLKDNSPLIAYPGQPSVEPAPEAKGYGIDGPLASYVDVDGATAWIYASMRRGGRHLYAFDVSTPQTPILLWRKGCPNMTNDTDCSTGFADIGQTWSEPLIVKAAGYGSGTSPMLLLGGGYDNCEDTDDGTANHSCTSSAKGRKIYLLNAETGAILQSFATDRSVVAKVSVVFTPGGDTIEYAYAADTGGNVYRISGATANSPIGSTAPGSWTITKIASVGCSTPSTGCAANRKFMFESSVVVIGSTHYVLLGSGDREKPVLNYVAASAVDNYFFMFKDKPTDATWLSTESGNCSANLLCLASLTPILTDNDPNPADLAASKGWYLGLASSEQVVTSALTVFGTTIFSTSQPVAPTPGQCSSLGEARVYNIGYVDASARNEDGERFANIIGDSLPPSPVAGLVTLDDGSTVPFVIGASGDSPFESGIPEDTELPLIPGAGTTSSPPRSRVYWNLEQ